MKTKKCMWCLNEFETDSNEKYCSIECKEKTEGKEGNKLKKGFFAVIGDLFGSLFG